MKCWHPNCTGVHDNNRYHELCPLALDRKRDKDQSYCATAKGMLKGLRSSAARRTAPDELTERLLHELAAMDAEGGNSQGSSQQRC